MVLSFLVQLQRPDFVTFTSVCLTFYYLEHRETLQRSKFRLLVALFVVSLLYDIIGFLIIDSNSEAELDGDAQSVRRFTMMMVSLSFMFRVFVLLVLWKDSIDFTTTLKEQVMLDSEIDSYERERRNRAAHNSRVVAEISKVLKN
jgi:hypothetical protein